MTEIFEDEIEEDYIDCVRFFINSGATPAIFQRKYNIPFECDAVIVSNMCQTSSAGAPYVLSIRTDLPIMNGDGLQNIYSMAIPPNGFGLMDSAFNFFLLNNKTIKGQYTFSYLDINNAGQPVASNFNMMLRFIKFKQQ